MDHLERAREELDRASETASGQVHRQLNSLGEGIFEEDEGDKTQADPGPKVDRIAELLDKLEALEREIEGGETGDHVANAREHLRAYLKSHPQGG